MTARSLHLIGGIVAGVFALALGWAYWLQPPATEVVLPQGRLDSPPDSQIANVPLDGRDGTRTNPDVELKRNPAARSDSDVIPTEGENGTASIEIRLAGMTVDQLEQERSRANREFLRARHKAALEAVKSGLAIASQGKSATPDGSLAAPDNTSDVVFVSLATATDRHLVALYRFEHPEVFALLDEIAAIDAISRTKAQASALIHRAK